MRLCDKEDDVLEPGYKEDDFPEPVNKVDDSPGPVYKEDGPSGPDNKEQNAPRLADEEDIGYNEEDNGLGLGTKEDDVPEP